MDSNETVPLYAYHPEGQAMIIAEEQRKNQLIAKTFVYYGHAIVPELGLEWVVLNGVTKLLALNCDLKAIKSLAPNEKLIEVKTLSGNPHASFGRGDFLVAGIFSQYNVLYKSPGFDPQKFFERRGISKGLNIDFEQ